MDNSRRIDVDKMEKLKEKVHPTVIDSLGPEKLHNSGLYIDSNDGWRAGYTKQTIEARKEKNRLKNKVARKSRKTNRQRSK